MHPRDTNDPIVYRRWYDLPRWRKRSREHKRLHPLCCMCLQQGFTVAADVADHCEPHRGDWIKMMYGPLQSLCNAHHSGEKRQLEINGYTRNIDESGWPRDENHPANRVK